MPHNFTVLKFTVLILIISDNESRSVVSDSLRPHGLYSPWNSPSQNTGMGSLSFVQGIFPIEESNPSFPHCSWVLYQLSHQGSPVHSLVGELRSQKLLGMAKKKKKRNTNEFINKSKQTQSHRKQIYCYQRGRGIN